ncbi:MAG: hypothetical protein AUJ49_09125 [Desulfovibrionaceae bacterium CG1_02_65_16]|nr:MAG: hypothetical protein AUJ49_09125 [Desulfovibrionaceae bacterium CG1_02_65_16]
MPTWLFILIVFGVGLGLAFYIDRLKSRPGSVPGESKKVSERSKWLYYWFVGRFPAGEDDQDERRGRKK